MLNRKYYLIFAIVIVGGIFNFFNFPQAKSDASAQQSAAMPVDTIVAENNDIIVWKNFSGRIEAVDRAEIRPQVTGRIMEVRFKDGQYVEKGDVLFVIDPRSYKAALDQAKARLQSTKNEYENAQNEYIRSLDLIKTQAISKKTFDDRKTILNVAKAAKDAAEASVMLAMVDFDNAYIKAPISGRISRAEITVGNLVGPNDTSLLTTIVSDDYLYANFEIDEKTFLQFIASKNQDEINDTPVRIKINELNKVLDGVISSFDNQINISTGTIRARAKFKNRDRILLSGMFVTIDVARTLKDQITIPEKTINTNQDKKFVYIVSKNNTVEYREVELGDITEGKRIVNRGLVKGDRVIINNLMMLRPDMPVAINEEKQKASN